MSTVQEVWTSIMCRNSDFLVLDKKCQRFLALNILILYNTNVLLGGHWFSSHSSQSRYAESRSSLLLFGIFWCNFVVVIMMNHEYTVHMIIVKTLLISVLTFLWGVDAIYADLHCILAYYIQYFSSIYSSRSKTFCYI